MVVNYQTFHIEGFESSTQELLNQMADNDCRYTGQDREVTTHVDSDGMHISWAYTYNSFGQIYRGGDYVVTIDPTTGYPYSLLHG